MTPRPIGEISGSCRPWLNDEQEKQLDERIVARVTKGTWQAVVRSVYRSGLGSSFIPNLVRSLVDVAMYAYARTPQRRPR